MSKGIAGFELHVRGIEAACKRSQNRDGEEQEAIAARLEQSEVSDDRAITAKEHLFRFRRLDDLWDALNVDSDVQIGRRGWSPREPRRRDIRARPLRDDQEWTSSHGVRRLGVAPVEMENSLSPSDAVRRISGATEVRG